MQAPVTRGSRAIAAIIERSIFTDTTLLRNNRKHRYETNNMETVIALLAQCLPNSIGKVVITSSSSDRKWYPTVLADWNP